LQQISVWFFPSPALSFSMKKGDGGVVNVGSMLIGRFLKNKEFLQGFKRVSRLMLQNPIISERHG
jgi:hypothetical protein